MNWKVLSFILLLSAVEFVQSKSYIEVDEAGNEFEVKRFHIQGRQLNDKNQQCVITRRKRSSKTNMPRQYSNLDTIYSVTADEEDSINNNLNKPDLNDKNDELASTEVDKNETISIPLPNMFIDKINDELKKGDESQPGEDEESKEPISNSEAASEIKDNKDSNRVIQKQKKEKLQKITLVRAQPSDETAEHLENEENTQLQSIKIIPSTLVSNTAGNNYVIVHSQKVPVGNPFLSVMPTEEDYGVQAEILPFSWSYENQPISTTAVWSTGDDIPSNVFNRIENIDDTDYEFGNEDEITDLGSKHPIRVTRNKNKYKTQIRKGINRRPVNEPVRRRPMRKNQNRPLKQIVRRKYHNKTPNENANKSRKRNSQAQPQGHKKNKNKAPLVVTSVTTITTEDPENNFECIIINKDTSTTTSTTTTTTTTTRRPFWNILGRSNISDQPRNYGLRKRSALRFIA